ncbi:MAG: glycoside hydrolase family 3 C-terminal domain-containing protein [Lachnospiraceae bacterium]|nr:glycoside hydrolase family 3 C-terminal domain-containing protein [Lachnospiraceae bacterium]
MKDWRENDLFRGECREKAKELVSKMTLQEKIDQILHTAPAIERLGIQEYNYWNEALHGVARAGVATVFPQSIGLAATFDEDFVEKIGDAISTEARAKYNMQQKYGDYDLYKGLNFFSPNVNIFRDPRWGRGHETFGEDPWLAGRMGVRFIEGMQGHDDTYIKASACAKHLAVHSGPEPDRHEFDAVVSKQDLRETYLPAFEACVKEAKVESVMGAYNLVNGEPACGSKTLLQDIMRGEWGFDGCVVSDCWAVSDFHQFHHITETWEESAAMALNNGLDLCAGVSYRYLPGALEQGLVTEEKITEACERVIALRLHLGIVGAEKENPYDQIPFLANDSEAMRQLNREAAARCVTLLKNENNTLPLKLDELKTIAVIGPNADSRIALRGNYEGTASRYVTVLEGIEDYVGEKARVLYAQGCEMTRDRTTELAKKDDRLAEAKAVCDAADVVIAVLGLDANLEGEQGDASNEYGSGDKPNLNLPGRQHALLETAQASGKPVVLVLMAGSALAVNWADDHVSAIVQAWYPGAQGGNGVADVLFGAKNPEGKLPVTFYRSVEELPNFKDYAMKGRTYRYMKNEALYPFGYGLSYSRFDVTDAKLTANGAEATCVDSNSALTCSCMLTNSGELAGAQTVQVYIRYVSEDAPNWSLKGLKKVFLEPGETKKVEIPLTGREFALYDEEGILVLNSGDYEVSVGVSQPDERSVSLLGQRPVKLTCRAEKEVILA